MPTKYNLLLRLISLCLIGTFAVQEIAHCAPETAISIPSKPLDLILADPSRFEAPLDFSTLREIHKGTNGKLIIHIQDAHSNVSGQQNLASMLDAIMEKYGVSLVLSEGGSKDCSLTPVKDIAPASVWKKVAHSYLLQGKLSGEEYLNLVSDRPMKIMGLEDLGLYVKSVQSYGTLAHKREDILAYLAKADLAVEKLKNKQYPKELLDYEKGKKAGDFDSNFKALLALAKTKQVDLSEFPELTRLVEIALEEKLIDLDAANLEQAALLDNIQKKGGGEKLREQFSKLSQAKNQKLSRLAYLENTFSLAKEKNVPLDIYPQILAYEEYLKHFASLDLEATLDQMEKTQEKVYASILSGDAATIHLVDRYLGLLRMAYRIQMTTKDFNRFQSDSPDFPTVSYLAFVNRQLADLGYFEGLVPYQGLFEEGKESLEDFYGSVEKRDFAFLANTEKIMSEENQKAAVLITGGYHTEHLMKLLTDKGYSIAVLSPIVTSETIQTKYEKRLLAPFDEGTKTVTSVRGEGGNEKSSGVRVALLGLAREEGMENDSQVLKYTERELRELLMSAALDATHNDKDAAQALVKKAWKAIVSKGLPVIAHETAPEDMKLFAESLRTKLGERLRTTAKSEKIFSQEAGEQRRAGARLADTEKGLQPNDPHLWHFSSRKADYIFHGALHGRETRLTKEGEAELASANAVIFESTADAMPLMDDFLENVQFKWLATIALKLGIPIFSGDRQDKMKALPETGNSIFDWKVWRHIILTIMFRAYFWVHILVFRSSGYLLRKYIRSSESFSMFYSSWTLFMNIFYMNISYTNAIIAEKIEEFVVPLTAQRMIEHGGRTDAKPKVFIEYGGEHADLFFYLKYRWIRKLVIALNTVWVWGHGPHLEDIAEFNTDPGSLSKGTFIETTATSYGEVHNILHEGVIDVPFAPKSGMDPLYREILNSNSGARLAIGQFVPRMYFIFLTMVDSARHLFRKKMTIQSIRPPSGYKYSNASDQMADIEIREFIIELLSEYDIDPTPLTRGFYTDQYHIENMEVLGELVRQKFLVRLKETTYSALDSMLSDKTIVSLNSVRRLHAIHAQAKSKMNLLPLPLQKRNAATAEINERFFIQLSDIYRAAVLSINSLGARMAAEQDEPKGLEEKVREEFDPADVNWVLKISSKAVIVDAGYWIMIIKGLFERGFNTPENRQFLEDVVEVSGPKMAESNLTVISSHFREMETDGEALDMNLTALRKLLPFLKGAPNGTFGDILRDIEKIEDPAARQEAWERILKLASVFSTDIGDIWRRMSYPRREILIDETRFQALLERERRLHWFQSALNRAFDDFLTEIAAPKPSADHLFVEELNTRLDLMDPEFQKFLRENPLHSASVYIPRPIKERIDKGQDDMKILVEETEAFRSSDKAWAEVFSGSIDKAVENVLKSGKYGEKPSEEDRSQAQKDAVASSLLMYKITQFISKENARLREIEWAKDAPRRMAEKERADRREGFIRLGITAMAAGIIGVVLFALITWGGGSMRQNAPPVALPGYVYQEGVPNAATNSPSIDGAFTGSLSPDKYKPSTGSAYRSLAGVDRIVGHIEGLSYDDNVLFVHAYPFIDAGRLLSSNFEFKPAADYTGENVAITLNVNVPAGQSHLPMITHGSVREFHGDGFSISEGGVLTAERPLNGQIQYEIRRTHSEGRFEVPDSTEAEASTREWLKKEAAELDSPDTPFAVVHYIDKMKTAKNLEERLSLIETFFSVYVEYSDTQQVRRTGRDDTVMGLFRFAHRSAESATGDYTVKVKMDCDNMAELAMTMLRLSMSPEEWDSQEVFLLAGYSPRGEDITDSQRHVVMYVQGANNFSREIDLTAIAGSGRTPAVPLVPLAGDAKKQAAVEVPIAPNAAIAQTYTVQPNNTIWDFVRQRYGESNIQQNVEYFAALNRSSMIDFDPRRVRTDNIHWNVPATAGELKRRGKEAWDAMSAEEKTQFGERIEQDRVRAEQDNAAVPSGARMAAVVSAEERFKLAAEIEEAEQKRIDKVVRRYEFDDLSAPLFMRYDFTYEGQRYSAFGILQKGESELVLSGKMTNYLKESFPGFTEAEITTPSFSKVRGEDGVIGIPQDGKGQGWIRYQASEGEPNFTDEQVFLTEYRRLKPGNVQEQSLFELLPNPSGQGFVLVERPSDLELAKRVGGDSPKIKNLKARYDQAVEAYEEEARPLLGNIDLVSIYELNMQAFAPDEWNDRDKAIERIRNLIDALKNQKTFLPHVITLNEALELTDEKGKVTFSAAQEVADALNEALGLTSEEAIKALGYVVMEGEQKRVGNQKGQFERSAILVRKEFVEPVVQYPFWSQNSPLLAAKLRLKNGSGLIVVTGHLTPFPWQKRERRTQIREMLRMVEEAQKNKNPVTGASERRGTLPVIISADFNPASGEEIAEWNGGSLGDYSDAYAALNPNSKGFTYSGHFGKKRLDLMLGKGTTPVNSMIDKLGFSDHFGLRVYYSLSTHVPISPIGPMAFRRFEEIIASLEAFPGTKNIREDLRLVLNRLRRETDPAHQNLLQFDLLDLAGRINFEPVRRDIAKLLVREAMRLKGPVTAKDRRNAYGLAVKNAARAFYFTKNLTENGTEVIDKLKTFVGKDEELGTAISLLEQWKTEYAEGELPAFDKIVEVMAIFHQKSMSDRVFYSTYNELIKFQAPPAILNISKISQDIEAVRIGLLQEVPITSYMIRDLDSIVKNLEDVSRMEGARAQTHLSDIWFKMAALAGRMRYRELLGPSKELMKIANQLHPSHPSAVEYMRAGEADAVRAFNFMEKISNYSTGQNGENKAVRALLEIAGQFEISGKQNDLLMAGSVRGSAEQLKAWADDFTQTREFPSHNAILGVLKLLNQVAAESGNAQLGEIARKLPVFSGDGSAGARLASLAGDSLSDRQLDASGGLADFEEMMRRAGEIPVQDGEPLLYQGPDVVNIGINKKIDGPELLQALHKRGNVNVVLLYEKESQLQFQKLSNGATAVLAGRGLMLDESGRLVRVVFRKAPPQLHYIADMGINDIDLVRRQRVQVPLSNRSVMLDWMAQAKGVTTEILRRHGIATPKTLEVLGYGPEYDAYDWFKDFRDASNTIRIADQGPVDKEAAQKALGPILTEFLSSRGIQEAVAKPDGRAGSLGVVMGLRAENIAKKLPQIVTEFRLASTPIDAFYGRQAMIFQELVQPEPLPDKDGPLDWHVRVFLSPDKDGVPAVSEMMVRAAQWGVPVNTQKVFTLQEAAQRLGWTEAQLGSVTADLEKTALSAFSALFTEAAIHEKSVSLPDFITVDIILKKGETTPTPVVLEMHVSRSGAYSELNDHLLGLPGEEARLGRAIAPWVDRIVERATAYKNEISGARLAEDNFNWDPKRQAVFSDGKQVGNGLDGSANPEHDLFHLIIGEILGGSVVMGIMKHPKLLALPAIQALIAREEALVALLETQVVPIGEDPDGSKAEANKKKYEYNMRIARSFFHTDGILDPIEDILRTARRRVDMIRVLQPAVKERGERDLADPRVFKQPAGTQLIIQMADSVMPFVGSPVQKEAFKKEPHFAGARLAATATEKPTVKLRKIMAPYEQLAWETVSLQERAKSRLRGLFRVMNNHLNDEVWAKQYLETVRHLLPDIAMDAIKETANTIPAEHPLRTHDGKVGFPMEEGEAKILYDPTTHSVAWEDAAVPSAPEPYEVLQAVSKFHEAYQPFGARLAAAAGSVATDASKPIVVGDINLEKVLGTLDRFFNENRRVEIAFVKNDGKDTYKTSFAEFNDFKAEARQRFSDVPPGTVYSVTITLNSAVVTLTAHAEGARLASEVEPVAAVVNMFPREAVRSIEEVEAAKDMMLMVISANKGLIPLGITSSKFALLDIQPASADGTTTVRLLDSVTQEAFTSFVVTRDEMRDAHRRYDATRAFSTISKVITEVSPEVEAAENYLALNSLTRLLFAQAAKGMTERKHVFLSVGVHGQDGPGLIAQIRELQRELETFKELHVSIELVDEHGNRIESFEGFQSETPEAGQEVKRMFSGALADGFFAQAKAAHAGLLPMESASTKDHNTYNVIPYKPDMRAAILMAIADKNDAKLVRVLKTLTGASDVNTSDVQIVQEVPQDATRALYEGRGLIVRALATLSQELYQAYVNLVATGSSA